MIGHCRRRNSFGHKALALSPATRDRSGRAVRAGLLCTPTSARNVRGAGEDTGSSKTLVLRQVGPSFGRPSGSASRREWSVADSVARDIDVAVIALVQE